MFYEKQPEEKRNAYKYMLSIIGSLSNLFSESNKPALYYRAHENCFCKYFEATNLARHDCSADASKGNIGIGLKTWVGNTNQKVAEFGKLKKILDQLDDDQLIIKISECRNDRITTTMNMYGLNEMIYHVVIRTDGKMNIEECNFDKIDISNIKRLKNKDGNNTIYFTDGKHEYIFNKAKTTLYMNFNDCIWLDEINVNIFKDPYEVLSFLFPQSTDSSNSDLHLIGSNKRKERRKLAIKLYNDTKKECIVNEKSGLNAWNAGGRKRDPNEVYIPFNKKDREHPLNKGFFPPQDTCFNLRLPDGQILSAKICQENGKAIMSNPNKALGKWLLRDVLELPEWTVVTYELLQQKGFDTVLFEKIDDQNYTIDFTDSQVYDTLYNNNI